MCAVLSLDPGDWTKEFQNKASLIYKTGLWTRLRGVVPASGLTSTFPLRGYSLLISFPAIQCNPFDVVLFR